MKIPVSWLREYVELPAESDAIAERLAMLGFPVEEIVRRPHVDGVVVGRLASVERHPNADRLFVCRVDVGEEAPLTIATAATNVAAGQIVPVARIGAKLPNLTIEKRTMRGIASEGMLCSPDELALEPEWFDADGIMQLDESVPVGANAVQALGLDDDVLDVEITSNRVDAMCAIGLARELSASYGVPLRLPSFENPGTGGPPTQPGVEIASPDCSYFVLQRFDGVRAGRAPARMRVRLALCGVRPISGIVDVSNYVMLETGEPTHFYDADRVRGAIVVRDARPDETLRTLDGVSRALDPQSLVIADDRAALGIAGVMGSEASEVTAGTTAILLEAATFSGARVRRSAQLAGLRTEASSRHERSIPPTLADVAAARAAHLLVSQGATACAPATAGAQPVPREIPLSRGDVERLLGLSLPVERIAQHLTSLGCEVRSGGDAMRVVAPPWRADLTMDADLVEEVARVEGYGAIEAAPLVVAAHDVSSREYERERRAARSMAALGYHEIITYSLRANGGEHAVPLRNPLSEEHRYLREEIAPALLENLARIARPYRLFEIGHTFAREGDVVVEVPLIAMAIAAERVDADPWRDEGFLRFKGDLEALIRDLTGRVPSARASRHAGLHPGKTAALAVDDVTVAHFGRVDPGLERDLDTALALYAGSVRLDRLGEPARARYHPPSRFPSTYRDLALSVGAEVSAESVEATTARAIGDICTAVRVFDEYRGRQIEQGHKSLAVRAVMQRFDGTITDEEADVAIARAVAALHERLGATVRV
jgi:phenylalanyl-tRNA synthetase beta chain